MTIDLDNLERLAKAALSRGEEDCESLDEWFSQEEFMSNMLLHPVDARFAEACKPRAMLELIAEVRRLQTDLASIERFAKNLREREDLCAIGGIHIHEHIKHLKTARESA